MIIEYINKIKSKILSVYTLSLSWIKAFLLELVKRDAFKFMAQVTAYGVLFNIPFAVFFDRSFTVFTVVAYGIVYYFVSEELPLIVYKIRGGKR